MLKIFAHEYLALGRAMESASMVLYMAASGPPSEPLDDDEKNNLKEELQKLKLHCEKLELTTSRELVSQAIQSLPETSRELNIVLAAVTAELKTRLFLFVPSHRARYYEENATILPEARTAFPAATKELLHAGNCYAASEYTASVFHSMRAAELILRAVAKHLNKQPPAVLEASEWHTLIEMIDGHAKALRQQPRTPARDAEIKFYSDAGSQFANFKDAFRKYVAHARETYEEVPSISILHRTREFLDTLSQRVSE